MKSLHVAFLVPHLGGGGAEMNALRLANALAAAGARVSMLAVRGGGPYESQLAPQVASVHIGSRRLPSTTLALICAVPALRRWLGREKPDVLVPVMDLPSLAALTACRGLRPAPRVALSIQNNPDAKLREGWIMRRAMAATLRWYPRADAIVALSQGVAGVLGRRLPAAAARIAVIPNIGVTDALAAKLREKVEETPASGRALVVAVGRLVEQKGYPFLLEAMALLVQRMDAELWILGKGPLEEDLKRRAADLGLGDRVRFLGFRPNPHAYMARADLFVLSSLWEGFGNVIVEAMASGAPVVSADCPYGPSEIIEDGVSGRLVPPADAQALAGAMREALADAAQRRRWSEAGRRRAEDYRDTAVASRWLELFERLRAA